MRMFWTVDTENHEHWINPQHVVELRRVLGNTNGTIIHLSDKTHVIAASNPNSVASEFERAISE